MRKIMKARELNGQVLDRLLTLRSEPRTGPCLARVGFSSRLWTTRALAAENGPISGQVEPRNMTFQLVGNLWITPLFLGITTLILGITFQWVGQWVSNGLAKVSNGLDSLGYCIRYLKSY